MAETATAPTDRATSFEFTPPPPNTPATNPGRLGRIGLALVPFTPVAFSGPEGMYAWGRLALYGTAAALTWQKQRQLSYILTGAAAVSLVSSLASNAWNGEGK